MPTLEKKEFFNSLLLNGFCFAVALYVIYDIICHSADLQVHLGDQMQPPECSVTAKKIVVLMVPAGFECRGIYVRVTLGSC